MGVVPFITGVAQGLGGAIDGVTEGFRAPGRARETAQRRAARAEQQRQADEDSARARVQGQLSFNDALQQQQQALPTQVATASAAQGLAEVGKDNDARRQVQLIGAQSNEVRQTLPVIGDQNVRTIGAKAGADVERLQGYRENVLTPQMEILRGTQGYDMAITQQFTGEQALTPQLLDLERDRMAMQQQQFEAQQSDPMRWVDAAARLAATAGLIFS